MPAIDVRYYRTKSKEMVYGFKGCSTTYVLGMWENEKHVSEPMLFTGLLDIKGDKLYKSDLLIDEANYLWEIKFKQGQFVAVGINSDNEQPLNTVNLYSKLIGNVYEKSQLISAGGS